jgi:hypothetical protein
MLATLTFAVEIARRKDDAVLLERMLGFRSGRGGGLASVMPLDEDTLRLAGLRPPGPTAGHARRRGGDEFEFVRRLTARVSRIRGDCHARVAPRQGTLRRRATPPACRRYASRNQPRPTAHAPDGGASPSIRAATRPRPAAGRWRASTTPDRISAITGCEPVKRRHRGVRGDWLIDGPGNGSYWQTSRRTDLEVNGLQSLPAALSRSSTGDQAMGAAGFEPATSRV